MDGSGLLEVIDSGIARSIEGATEREVAGTLAYGNCRARLLLSA